MESIKSIEKRRSFLNDNSVKCKCSHTMAIPFFKDRVLCNWCGNWVYRTSELEKKYKEEQKKKDFIKNMKGILNEK